MTLEGSTPDIAGRKLGDFTIEAELGRGGMGVVYRARQESMGRTVALKTLPSFVGMDHDAVARFRREAEAAGRLSHPGIVPIYAVGEAEGVHYYAMELVEGPSLSALVDSLADREPERLLGTIAEECEGISDNNSLSLSLSGARYSYSCAAIVADLASALATAHRGMVIHRDIKPSNVLIRDTGAPVLVDFGLARDEMSVGLTQSGDALGTPAYMAPEQARGESDLDARVDIYGLGALLYEMLTLRPPFDGAHPGEIMRKIVDQDPVPVRQLNPRVPPDLEKIVHTCLAKRADDRYAAAEALEMDLRAFLDGREVVARKPRVIDRVRRVMRRDRRAVAVGFVVMAFSALAFSVVGVISDQRSEQEGHEALAQALVQGRSGSIKGALAAYGHAQALLPPEVVATAKLEHLPAVFESLYQEQRFTDLREYLSTWSPDERDDSWLAFDARLRGRGSLKLSTSSGAITELTRVTNRLEPWRPFSSGDALPIGDVLVRVTEPGYADVVQRVSIERDETQELTPLRLPSSELPLGFVLVPDPDRGVASFVSRTELSVQIYQELLERLSPELREELKPRRWEKQIKNPSLPVVDLSFAQARTAAALLGMHVLNEREYMLAANGGLEALRFPWGPTFDSANVAADSFSMNEPLPVSGQLTSASPHSILNLVGNVGEMLSAGHESWRVPIAGGNYLSDESELACDSREWFEHLTHRRPRVGVRLGRFVDPVSDGTAQAEVERRVVEMFQTGFPSILQEWVVRADGSARLDCRALGNHPEDRRHVEGYFATLGFAQVGAFEARDGHGRPLETVEHELSRFRESSRFKVDLGRRGRKGQQFQWRFGVDLEPRAYLTGRADVYALHVPLNIIERVRSMTTVTLPEGCRIESIEPQPTSVYADHDRQVLVWAFDADQSGRASVPAVVRFRRDGLLATEWPGRDAVVAAVDRFVSAMNDGDRAALEHLLAEEFRQFPHDRGKAKTIAALCNPDYRPESIGSNWHLIDAVPVGNVITTWAEFDWQTTERDGTRVTLKNWPMRVMLRRGDDGEMHLLELAPASGTDTGTLESGVYRNDALWVEFDPPADTGGEIRRLDRFMADMQITCFPSEKPDPQQGEEVSFFLLGVHAPLDIDDAMMRHRLTDGAWSMLPGERLNSSSQGSLLGGLERGKDALVSDWRFERQGGVGFYRERWALLKLGRRWFLSRARARATTRERADELFRQYGEFYDTMEKSVSIREKSFESK